MLEILECLPYYLSAQYPAPQGLTHTANRPVTWTLNWRVCPVQVTPATAEKGRRPRDLEKLCQGHPRREYGQLVLAYLHQLIRNLKVWYQARGYKTFFVLNSAEHKIYLLINVKMPTLISMINTTSERLKARNVFIFQHFSFHEWLKFHIYLS